MSVWSIKLIPGEIKGQTVPTSIYADAVPAQVPQNDDGPMDETLSFHVVCR
jgi:hypothetical protein